MSCLNRCNMALLMFALLMAVAWATTSDEILNLPGLSQKQSFKQFAGYLKATDDRQVFYWFVLSQSSPATDPLILWLNGGPTCSSLTGCLSENGPFRVSPDDETKLLVNPYSWNQKASVLYLEQPAGVGFSYREHSDNYTTGDDAVADSNHAALRSFFDKYPEFKKNDLFLTGESYAGIYIPTLAVKLLTDTPNLKGFAIGNGLLDLNIMGDSMILFAYNHGIIGQRQWSQLMQRCCNGYEVTGVYDRNMCRLFNRHDSECVSALIPTLKSLHPKGLFPKNIYQACNLTDKQWHMFIPKCSSGSKEHSHMPSGQRDIVEWGDTPYDCMEQPDISVYLNQESVRKALHVSFKIKKWQECNFNIEHQYHVQYRTVKPLILQLINAGQRGLIYHGDLDMMCSSLGGQWFTDDLGLRVKAAYAPWYVSEQVAGYQKVFHGLTFTTIRGSGHYVPTDKPMVALHMINRFVQRRPL